MRSIALVALLGTVTSFCAAACDDGSESPPVAPVAKGQPGSGANTSADGGPAAPSAPDAGADAGSEAGAEAGPVAPSRCQVTATSVHCEHNVTKLVAGLASRDVYWQTPSTPAPAGGYPVVIVYQGSFASPSLTWGTLTPSYPYGGFHQGRLQAMLLDNGFTVIAPEAAVGSVWPGNTGIPYDLSNDHDVVEALVTAIGNDRYGAANLGRLYATGISSGGYQTSRMAVSHHGKFRALAIHSASYATCLGPICNVPALPSNHPPTLLLEGALDTTVPLSTVQSYRDALTASAIENQLLVDPAIGHAWGAESPERITQWFLTH